MEVSPETYTYTGFVQYKIANDYSIIKEPKKLAVHIMEDKRYTVTGTFYPTYEKYYVTAIDSGSTNQNVIIYHQWGTSDEGTTHIRTLNT